MGESARRVGAGECGAGGGARFRGSDRRDVSGATWGCVRGGAAACYGDESRGASGARAAWRGAATIRADRAAAYGECSRGGGGWRVVGAATLRTVGDSAA